MLQGRLLQNNLLLVALQISTYTLPPKLSHCEEKLIVGNTAYQGRAQKFEGGEAI